MFKPNNEEYIDVYSEEQSEELGIDYLESSFSESDSITENSVNSPLRPSSNRQPRRTIREGSPSVCNKYMKMGVSSIIFNMVDGSTYEITIHKRG
jgi:hypothetical protein